MAPIERAALESPESLQQHEDVHVKRNIEVLLNDPARVNVTHSFSLHNMVSVPGGFRLHLVLRFRYHESSIELFGAEKPSKDAEKRYGEAHRLFPYCIINSVEEDPISWTYQRSENGQVYERIELFTTVTSVEYMRYFPFVLKLLNLKVASDGTAKTGVINLLPELKPDTTTPNVDFAVFTKETSAYHIKPDGIEKGDVICRMVVRDLTGDSLGNLSGIYTRIYTVFFFEEGWIESFLNYIVFSTLMLHLTMFLPKLGLDSMVGTVLAVVLTEVALLFVMPATNEFTTTESVVLAHALYVLACAFVVGLTRVEEETQTISSSIEPWHMLLANSIVTLATVAWLLREYRAYIRLVRTIKEKFKSVHAFVGMFKDIDGQI